MAGRKLRLDSDPFEDVYETGASKFERTYTLSAEEIRAGHKEIAAKTARQLFDLYGLDISIGVIGQWQEKLISRSF